MNILLLLDMILSTVQYALLIGLARIDQNNNC